MENCSRLRATPVFGELMASAAALSPAASANNAINVNAFGNKNDKEIVVASTSSACATPTNASGSSPSSSSAAIKREAKTSPESRMNSDSRCIPPTTSTPIQHSSVNIANESTILMGSATNTSSTTTSLNGRRSTPTTAGVAVSRDSSGTSGYTSGNSCGSNSNNTRPNNSTTTAKSSFVKKHVRGAAGVSPDDILPPQLINMPKSDRSKIIDMSAAAAYTNYAMSPNDCYETEVYYGDESGRDFQEEFLPICDALFNVISLAAYFCDIVFDSLTAYSFYKDGIWVWATVSVLLISSSVILSQILSFRWYRKAQTRGNGQEVPCSRSVLYLMHIAFCGVLWRYFKLFIPVDLRFIKNEVRDLCLLRLVHGFVQAAPMLLIQLYLILLKESPEETTELNIVSTALSLFNVCWALASFSKNIRRQNVHKLVLTWLGVIFQFLWRLGTVTSRVLVLCVYATIYSYWVLLVIALHWLCMFMWLISPKNVFHGEKMSTVKKTCYTALIAVVYIFCYINIQESNSRQKLIIFYVTMFLENSLLFSVWLLTARYEGYWFKEMATSLVLSTFLLGLAFMTLYYKYFHVTKLSYAYETGTTSTYRGYSSGSTYYNTNPSSPYSKSYDTSDPAYNTNDNNVLTRAGDPTRLNGAKGFLPNRPNGYRTKDGRSINKINGHHHHHPPNVPGVFNCRFHPAMKRKKKKPTTFIPPPTVAGQTPTRGQPAGPAACGVELPESHVSPPNKSHPIRVGPNGKMANPFWKRPLSVTMGSENEGSCGSRVDIQQKLQEKKQQQLAELREIEEEIKQGKLIRPHISEMPEPVSGDRQPIPFEKKQPWFRSDPPVQLSPRPPIIVPPHHGASGIPSELVLDPASLMYTSINGFYDQPDWNFYEPLYENQTTTHGPTRPSHSAGSRAKHAPYPNKSYRIASDIDSQMSLPRSYTLPREFKYKRKLRKPIKQEQFLPSTNSSDGDVDSADEDSEIYSHLRPYPLPLPSIRRIHMAHQATAASPPAGNKRQSGGRRHRLHETKL